MFRAASSACSSGHPSALLLVGAAHALPRSALLLVLLVYVSFWFAARAARDCLVLLVLLVVCATLSRSARAALLVLCCSCCFRIAHAAARTLLSLFCAWLVFSCAALVPCSCTVLFGLCSRGTAERRSLWSLAVHLSSWLSSRTLGMFEFLRVAHVYVTAVAGALFGAANSLTTVHQKLKGGRARGTRWLHVEAGSRAACLEERLRDESTNARPASEGDLVCGRILSISGEV